nr:hypothetical protein [Tanacetum cinerariifolium]
MDYEKEEKKLVEPESKGKKGKRIKRVADSTLKQKSSKKQKMMQEQESTKNYEEELADYEQEKEELRMWLKTLIKLRSEIAKEKGVTFRDVEEPPRLTRSTITLQPLLAIDPKDKGKGVVVEEELEKL